MSAPMTIMVTNALIVRVRFSPLLETFETAPRRISSREEYKTNDLYIRPSVRPSARLSTAAGPIRANFVGDPRSS